MTLFANNIVQASKGPVIDDRTRDIRLAGNIVNPLSGASLGVSRSDGEVRAADPKLLKQGEIYQLSSQSPAIDAAAASFVTEDIQGRARARPDVGAEEWSKAPAQRRPLAEADVGPDAP